MLKRELLLIIPLLVFFGCIRAQQMKKPVAFQVEGLKNALVGISVKNVKNGHVVADYQAEASLHPASVTKLLTTAMALKLKGGNYHYLTKTYYSGEIQNGSLDGNVIIQAVGDPGMDSKYFSGVSFSDQFITALQKKGIQKIKGKIIIEHADERILPGSWPWEDLSNYYGAQCHGFNYRDNTYTIEFKSGKIGERVELKSVNPLQPGIHFENQVVASGNNRDDAWIFGGPYSKTLSIQGTIPANRAGFKIKGAIHHPADCFCREFADRLKGVGIALENQTISGGERRELLFYASPSLEELVYHTNKSSVNLFAEAIGKLIVEKDYEGGVHRLLTEAGIVPKGVILKDACGLSHLNAVPASVFTDLLIWADRNIGDSFVNSLPVAGIDGALAEYSKGNTFLLNNLKAKTGSFAGVRCLSGYLTTKSGEHLAFTILVNNYACPVSQLYQVVRNYLNSLANA